MTNYAEQDARRSTQRAAFVAAVPAIVTALRTLEPKAGWMAQPWKVDDYGPTVRWVRLQNADDESVTLQYDEYKNRISASADWPRLPDGTCWSPRSYRDESTPAMGVTADKAPAQIARDLVRRFLPDYRVMLGKAREAVAGQTAYADKTVQTFDALMRGGAGHLKPNHDSLPSQRRPGRELSASIYDTGGVSYGTVRVSGDSVTFERMSTTAACAGMLVRAIVACGRKEGR